MRGSRREKEYMNKYSLVTGIHIYIYIYTLRKYLPQSYSHKIMR